MLSLAFHANVTKPLLPHFAAADNKSRVGLGGVQLTARLCHQGILSSVKKYLIRLAVVLAYTMAASYVVWGLLGLTYFARESCCRVSSKL